MNENGQCDRSFYRRFLQIPGPNPLLVAGGPDAWDEELIECADVFKDRHTYYLYYHGMSRNSNCWPTPGKPNGQAYRIGVAAADHPLGPWKKHEGNPILDLGGDGSWENVHVACPHVIKEAEDLYFMWYSACSKTGIPDVGPPAASYRDRDAEAIASSTWDIGLATASHPFGPWKKSPGNPILRNFGYIGSVLKVNGRYLMYTEFPVGGSSPDLGPMCVAVADRPEGPWQPYEGNPVLAPDDWGGWDDSGFSEGKVLYHDGMFHMFYGGVKWKKLERIGYAYSRDGFHFTKYPGNPIGLTEHSPDSEAFSEIHTLSEPPLIYLYHTIRYRSTALSREDIGVQVMATEDSFRFSMPLLRVAELRARSRTALDLCPPVRLEHITVAALGVEATYASAVRQGLIVHVLGSSDGLRYDTEDLYRFDIAAKPGETVRRSLEVRPAVLYMKVVLENPDPAVSVVDVALTATLGRP